ncbi:hypothetical protein R1flu_023018 [Riccia fluitans]|uniref:RNA helicase n=1 Tax=Riccia fluitans TaxID=41844 RepID=A0ABD1XTT4_9MARC
MILVRDTGSGKATQIPQFVLEAGYAANRNQIARTQPRRVAAMAAADEMDIPTGEEVGLQLSFRGLLSDPKTILKYWTEASAEEQARFEAVVMSATFESEKFQAYFDGASILEVSGRLHTVDILYSPFPEEDYLEAAIRKAAQIHACEGPGDILVFLIGA